jgi:hypothetical protein
MFKIMAIWDVTPCSLVFRFITLLPFVSSYGVEYECYNFFRSWHYVKGKVVPVHNVIKHFAMKAYGKWMYRATFYWPRLRSDVSGHFHASAALPPGKKPLLPIRGWMGPWVSLEDLERGKFVFLSGLKCRHLSYPSHSQLRYRLRVVVWVSI